MRYVSDLLHIPSVYKLETQQFLLAGRAPEELTSVFGIRVKQHPAYPALYHLAYDQLESPKDNALVQECRGLILDSSRGWEVVAYPFRRFANHGEGWADQIDWRTARVQEKLDGSLLVLWHYDGKWNVSTKGSPDASGTVGDFGFTFAELFWKTMEIQLPFCYRNLQHGDTEATAQGHSRDLDVAQTYLWELTSPYNRVVCSYGSTATLTLIGVRDKYNLREHPVQAWEDLGIPVVREFPLTSVSEVIAAAEQLDPMQGEGFVVVDDQYRRVKIKSPAYVAVHHMKDGFGQRRMIRLIQLGESSELLTYFPEYRELYEEIAAKVDAVIAEVESDWLRLRHIEDRKTFALEAVQTRVPDTLFALHQGKATSVRDHVLHARRKDGQLTNSEEKIERLLGLKKKEPVLVD